MTLSAFLSRLTRTNETEILYLQSQNGNIYRSTAQPGQELPELHAFQESIKPDLEWMKDAIGEGNTDCEGSSRLI